MHSKSLLSLFAVSAASVAANNDYVTGLVNALTAEGLNEFASAVSSAPASLIEKLQTGNHNVFAPTDVSFTDFKPTDFKEKGLPYHITAKAVSYEGTSSAHPAVVETLLDLLPTVNLPEGKGQAVRVYEESVVSFTPPDTTTEKDVIFGRGGPDVGPIVNQKTFNYENLVVHVVSGILSVPTKLSEWFATTGTNLNASYAQALKAFLPGFTETLDITPGITVFIPSGDAFSVNPNIFVGVPNETIQDVLRGHVINGTVLYSSSLVNGTTATSLTGQTLTFSTNENRTATFVTVGDITAEIFAKDTLLANGVAHHVGKVFFNPSSSTGSANAGSVLAAQKAASESTSTSGASLKTVSGFVLGAAGLGLGAALF